MKYIRLYLVRHGHVQYFDEQHQPVNPKYAALSTQGEQQIQLLAEQLKAIQMDQIFSSTMPRSIQTAEILSSAQKNPIIHSFDEIREIKSGRLKNIPDDQAEILIRKAYYPKKYELKDFLLGEAWSSFEQRITHWFEAMLLQEFQAQHQHILVSSHDAVNRIVLNWIYGLKGQDVQVQEQNYACLNIVDFYIEDQKIQETRILLQNFTAHNILKINESGNALDHVYEMYMKANGFKKSNGLKGEVA